MERSIIPREIFDEILTQFNTKTTDNTTGKLQTDNSPLNQKGTLKSFPPVDTKEKQE